MNVIILTTGISGSSVMTGLLSKAGLWTGNETVFKDNMTGTYETYENKKLVELDETLFKEANIEYDVKTRYYKQAREEFNVLFETIDTTRYREFIAECNEHSPWIWKDPRLFLAIGFWVNLLDLSNTKVIVIHRNTYELWKSQIIKRVIYSYQYLKKSENSTRQGLLQYLDSKKISYKSIEYDGFTSNPEKSIEELNKFIGTKLTMKNWDEIYRPTSWFSKIKRAVLAYLIYLKNYNSRIK